MRCRELNKINSLGLRFNAKERKKEGTQEQTTHYTIGFGDEERLGIRPVVVLLFSGIYRREKEGRQRPPIYGNHNAIEENERRRLWWGDYHWRTLHIPPVKNPPSLPVKRTICPKVVAFKVLPFQMQYLSTSPPLDCQKSKNNRFFIIIMIFNTTTLSHTSSPTLLHPAKESTNCTGKWKGESFYRHYRMKYSILPESRNIIIMWWNIWLRRGSSLKQSENRLIVLKY